MTAFSIYPAMSLACITAQCSFNFRMKGVYEFKAHSAQISTGKDRSISDYATTTWGYLKDASHYSTSMDLATAQDYFLPKLTASHCWRRVMTEEITLFSICQYEHSTWQSNRTHPKIPMTPSLRFTRPRFVAGTHTSRRSTRNWKRVASRSLQVHCISAQAT